MNIRAHHGLCLFNFIGKGYSSDFVSNMTTMKQRLEAENPVVNIVTECDSICQHCPNNIQGNCLSCKKVERYDKKVLQYCDIKEQGVLSWQEFSEIVNQKIREKGIRKEICLDCEWNEICTSIESK